MYAYDANDVSTTLYSSSQAGTRDQAGPATKFVTPTMANGKVYLPTLAELDVYGLLAGQSATTTELSTSANPVYGAPITLSATVTSTGGTPTGNVTFYLKDGFNIVGVSPLVGNKASIQINGLSVGAHTYNATYMGTGSLRGKFGCVTFSVNKAPTTTVINSSSLNPSIYGQPVTFTATVTSTAGAGTPTGTVTFEKAAATSGQRNSMLQASPAIPLQLPSWWSDVSITAVYNPDTDHAKSTSAVFNQTVNPEASSTAFTSSPNPSTVGQFVTFTATVTATVGTPTGNVVFMNGTTLMGTVALVNGTATLNHAFKNKGAFKLSANYQGSTNNSPSSMPLTEQVNQ